MNRQSLSLLVLATLVSGPGLAQSETSAELPRYDVELVIFKNLQVPKSREFVLPVSSPAKDKKMLVLSSANSVKAAKKLGYEVISGKQYRLTDVAKKLVKSSRYELLLHTAWRQPGVEQERALPVWIRGGRIYGNEYTSIDSQIELLESMPKVESKKADGTTNEFDEQTLESIELQLLEQQSSQRPQRLYELEGKITIGLSRYLHAYTDLVLRRPRLSIDQETTSSAQNRTLAAYSADTLILNNHRLRERRRMRSKNLHYLDSPEFALLILITPYEVPEVVEEAPVEAELAPTNE
ncbi:MAG: peptidoglycan binding protein CsiV [Gammaproteobacteria bacterium]|nr:peptidoglycan binding protein CsiV [Gammaproteobacteria bacterium]